MTLFYFDYLTNLKYSKQPIWTRISVNVKKAFEFIINYFNYDE